MKTLRKLQPYHCSILIFFSGGFNSSFGIKHTPFLFFQCFSYAGAPLNHPLLAIQLFQSDEDISEDSSFHSQFTQVLLRMLSHSSHLIQPVQSLLQIVQRCIFWVGPNPHVIFSGSYLTLLIFPGATLNSFEVWRKNDLSSVKCLSPRSVKFFSSLAQSLRFWFFRSASSIIGGVSCRHSQIFWRPKKIFTSIFYPFS